MDGYTHAAVSHCLLLLTTFASYLQLWDAKKGERLEKGGRAVTITKLFAWGEGDIGGHVLRVTTSRGLCGLVCPSRTSKRGGEGDCVKEGVGGEGEREKERALGLLLCHNP